MFNVNIRFRVKYIPELHKKLSFVEIGGGGFMVAISNPSLKYYRLPIYNFDSFDYYLTFSHTAAILD